MSVVISDASPLVHLSAINRFDLLKELYLDLLIPPAVWEEVTTAGRGRPGEKEVGEAVRAGWMKVKAPDPLELNRSELQGLDSGEREALALAMQTRAEVVLLDELRGRRVAKRLGVPTIGTLGVLVEAKQRGLIPNIRGELRQLQEHSQLQLTIELEQLVLRLAGEDHSSG